jgi:hypothetical protein
MGIGFWIIKIMIPFNFPPILIGTPVPLGGLPIFIMGGPCFGGLGGIVF